MPHLNLEGPAALKGVLENSIPIPGPDDAADVVPSVSTSSTQEYVRLARGLDGFC